MRYLGAAIMVSSSAVVGAYLTVNQSAVYGVIYYLVGAFMALACIVYRDPLQKRED